MKTHEFTLRFISSILTDDVVFASAMGCLWGLIALVVIREASSFQLKRIPAFDAMCVRVDVHTHIHTYIHTYIHTQMQIRYIHHTHWHSQTVIDVVVYDRFLRFTLRLR
jgi:hypothetical protein